MNNHKENIYCDDSGSIFNSLNNSLLDLQPNPNYPCLHFKYYKTILCHKTKLSEKGNGK
jgi:hypothetical protein